MLKNRISCIALLTLTAVAGAISYWPGPVNTAAQENVRISQQALRQIEALNLEKDSRTPAQQKIDSQFLYALKRNRPEYAAAFRTMVSAAAVDANGNVLVDISANVTPDLLSSIKSLGGEVLSSYEEFKAIQARVPLESLEAIAESEDVKWIGPADQAMTNREVPSGKPRPRGSREERLARVREQLLKVLPAAAGSSAASSAFIGAANSEGDVAHKADLVRNVGFNGTGIRIGVISDSYNNNGGAATDVTNGDLPGPGNPFGNTTAVTVVQDLGSGGTDEGRAMLHLVHDLVPAAQLFFATGSISQAGMAANIIALRNTNNCQIIVDDLTYYFEGVFQDDVIAQAVNTVTAAGALYFSSAGNSGNLNDGTAGVWEGDFNDGGAMALIPGGTVHDFGGGALSNLINQTGGGTRPITLKWSDPLGASNNDYDLYILNGALTAIIASSTNTQNGSQNPIESIANNAMTPVFNAGNRIVILRRTGEAQRALHLNSNRGQLAIATSGVTFGHNAVGSGFCVAAVDVATAGGGVFTGGAANPVETFSSDGLRRIFYTPAGVAITAGNFLFGTNGGQVLQKPDLAAADGAATNVGGFMPFFGTSAAAPHAAAVAALVWSSNLGLTAAQVRTALTSTALDIEAAGVDRDSGVGIVMALEALASLTPVADLRITKQVAPDPVTTGANMTIILNVTNLGPSTATNVVVTDNLPATTTFSSCASSLGGVCGGSGNNRTVTLASLAVNATAIVTIGATANCNVSTGTVVLNNASVTGNQPDPVAANNSSSDSTTINNPPPEITCPPDIDTFSDPGQLYATLNPGTPTATDAGGCPVVVSGTRSDGQPLNATYPVGTTTIEWKATDAVNQIATCIQTIKVRTLADVRVVIDPLTNPAKVKQFLTYRVEIINDGPSPALGVQLTDTVAMDQFFVSVTAGPGVGSCSFNPGTRIVSCDMGQINHFTAKYALITVKPQFRGLTSNQASAAVDTILTLDPNLANNTFTKWTNVVP
jgi:uncharacterized repeat protein (TIGR01451 family)